MSTKILVFLLVIAIGDGLTSKVTSRNYPTSYSSGYAHPTGSTRQKDTHYRYFTTSDLSSHSSTQQLNKAQSFDVGSGSGQYVHSSSGQENWSPSSGWNGTYLRYTNGYIRPSYNRDPIEGSHSLYQYQHVRPPLQTGFVTYKKPSPYYGKGKIVKTPEKPKQKKPQYLYYTGQTGYKKSVYPRVHMPYAMHKYPTKKTAHPYYRRYYQVPYVVPSADMLRSKVKNIYAYGGDSSTAATPSVTTDRIYNADGNDYPATSEDYSVNYNDTHPSRPNTYSNYYDNYEETEQTTSEPNSYEETSTRGYYGDRIYMNSQPPSQSAEKGMKHRFFVVRSEPEENEDDLETIFD